MIRPFRGVSPQIHPTAFVEESAQVVGDVHLGAQLATADAAARKGVMCGGDSDFHDAERHPDLLALLSDDDFGKWKM